LIKWFKRKDNIEEKQHFEEVKAKQEPILRELIREEAKNQNPVDVRINEALDKLITKIHEKHFSPEIQKALKEMDGPLTNTIYINNKRSLVYTETLATVSLNKIEINYYYNIYDYKSIENIRTELASIIRTNEYDPTTHKYLNSIEKTLIEHIYNYFFDGTLEKDIEKQTKLNRDYESRKEKEKLAAADRLCNLIKEQKP
jgi:hypothetical protein